MKQHIVLLIMVFLLFSCEELINEEDISEVNVQLLAPTNNTVIRQGNVSFNWKELSGADEYKLQIATPNFISAIQIVLDTTLSKNSFIKNLEVGNYEWRVRAENSAYETDFTTHALAVEEISGP